MNERDRVHVGRMKHELGFIQKNIAVVGKDTFMNNEVLQHALAMSLVTLGECANHLSDDFKETHSDIEWIQLIAVRNIAAHGYWQLNMEQLWQAVEDDVPELAAFFAK